VPVTCAGCNGICDQRTHDRSDAIDGVEHAEPAMGVLHSGGKRIRLRILVGDAHAGEEERGCVQRIWRLPEHERISGTLDDGPGHKSSACAQAGTDVDVCERGEEPSGEVDDVNDGNLEQADIVSWLQVRYEDTCSGIYIISAIEQSAS